MAIDYGISLDTGASDITYSGDEGPKSPDHQLMASADPMLVEEYKKYVFEMEEQGQTPISFKQFIQQIMAESRMAEGGKVPNIGPSGINSLNGWGSTDSSQNIAGADISAGMDRDSGHSGWDQGRGSSQGVSSGPTVKQQQLKKTVSEGLDLNEIKNIGIKNAIRLNLSKRNKNNLYPGRDNVDYPWSDEDEGGINSIFAKGPVDLHIPYHGPGQWDYSTFPPVNTPDTPETLNFAFKKGSLLDKKINQAYDSYQETGFGLDNVKTLMEMDIKNKEKKEILFHYLQRHIDC